MTGRVALPDFEILFNLIDEIFSVFRKKLLLESELKYEEAKITRLITNDPKYFQNNKVPSQTFIDNAYKHTGFNNELLEKRNELADLTARLEQCKLKFTLYRDLIDLYRTQSADERAALL